MVLKQSNQRLSSLVLRDVLCHTDLLCFPVNDDSRLQAADCLGENARIRLRAASWGVDCIAGVTCFETYPA
jgi:hypothetical protein